MFDNIHPPYKIQNHVNYVTFYLNYWFFIYSGLSVWPKLYHKIWLPIFSLLMNKDNRGNKDSFWKGVPFLKFIYRGHSTRSFYSIEPCLIKMHVLVNLLTCPKACQDLVMISYCFLVLEPILKTSKLIWTFPPYITVIKESI